MKSSVWVKWSLASSARTTEIFVRNQKSWRIDIVTFAKMFGMSNSPMSDVLPFWMSRCLLTGRREYL